MHHGRHWFQQVPYRLLGLELFREGSWRNRCMFFNRRSQGLSARLGTVRPHSHCDGDLLGRFLTGFGPAFGAEHLPCFLLALIPAFARLQLATGARV
jgi:hypothetical protein